MDYSEKARWEIIRMMLDNNTAGRTPKQIANFFTLALVTVTKWGADPESSGADIPSKYEVPLMIYCQDFRLLEWLAQQVGRRTVVIGEGNIDGRLADQFFNIDMLKGKLSETLKKSIADGNLDRFERNDLTSNLLEIIKECETGISELKKKGVKFA